MRRNVVSCASILLLALCLTAQASTVPLLIPHQGRLLDAADVPVSGMRALTFALYEVQAGGVALWTEVHGAVMIEEGLFTVNLGSVTPLSQDLLSPPSSPPPFERYLEVRVDGVALTPRIRLATVPYSMTSTRVDGDVVTAPGELGITTPSSDQWFKVTTNDDPGLQESRLKLVAGSGSATGTILASQDAGSSMELADQSGSTTATIRAQNDSAGMELGSGTAFKATTWTSFNSCIATVSNAAGTKGIATGTSPTKSSITMLEGGLESSSLESNDDSTGLMLSGARFGRPAVNTARVSVGEVSSNLALVGDSNGDLHAEQQLTATARFSDGTTMAMTTDSDDDGVPDSEIECNTHASSSRIGLGGMSGSTTGTIRMMASPDSTVETMDADSDDDGLSDARVVIRIRPRDALGEGSEGSVEVSTDRAAAGPRQSVSMDGSFSHAQHQCVTDLDRDGFEDVVVASSSSADGAKTKWYADADDDGLGDNIMEAMVTPTMCSHVSTTKGTGAQAGHFFLDGSRSQDDGVIKTFLWKQLDGPGGLFTEREVSMDIDSGGSSMSISNADGSRGQMSVHSGMSGSTTGTIRMTADDDEVTDALDIDDDGDGVSEKYYVLGCTHSKASSLLASDDDEDGEPNTFAETTILPSTGTYQLCYSTNQVDWMRIKMEVGADGFKSEYEVDGQRRMLMQNDSGLVLTDATGTGSSRIGDNGQADFSTSVAVGGATSSHYIDVQGGAYCDGTNWVNASDVASKENFKRVDGEELLDRIADLKISRWNYKGQKGVEHIGPTAQDFRAAFGVGSDDKSISTIDPSGIALAAIQELQKQNRNLQAENADLRSTLEALTRKVDALVATR